MKYTTDGGATSMENALPVVIQSLDWWFRAYRQIGARLGHGPVAPAGYSSMRWPFSVMLTALLSLLAIVEAGEVIVASDAGIRGRSESSIPLNGLRLDAKTDKHGLEFREFYHFFTSPSGLNCHFYYFSEGKDGMFGSTVSPVAVFSLKGTSHPAYWVLFGPTESPLVQDGKQKLYNLNLLTKGDGTMWKMYDLDKSRTEQFILKMKSVGIAVQQQGGCVIPNLDPDSDIFRALFIDDMDTRGYFSKEIADSRAITRTADATNVDTHNSPPPPPPSK